VLALESITYFQERAEVLGRDSRYRDSFDVVTSKAFAPLNQLLEFCAPFVKKGGKLYAWKGIHYMEEMKKTGEGYSRLNLSAPVCHDFFLSEENLAMTILVFEKTSVTPEMFPRSYQAIRRRPVSGDL
jgi:16S rRNA (guanine527-N7)-methyltransferase